MNWGGPGSSASSFYDQVSVPWMSEGRGALGPATPGLTVLTLRQVFLNSSHWQVRGPGGNGGQRAGRDSDFQQGDRPRKEELLTRLNQHMQISGSRRQRHANQTHQ